MLGSEGEPLPLSRTDTRDTTDQLPRTLGVVSTAGLLVGITIGSGIFRVPSIVAGELGSVGGVTLVWLAGAAVALAGALTIVALMTALPRSGGAYVYIREAYDPLVGFLYGWIKMIVTGPAAIAAVALIFAEYTKAFTPLTDTRCKSSLPHSWSRSPRRTSIRALECLAANVVDDHEGHRVGHAPRC